MSLKERLDNLDNNKKEQLIYAFNHSLTQFVRLDDNKYIGVNVDRSKNFMVIEEAGDWSYGEVI